jgi:hypothetical protein
MPAYVIHVFNFLNGCVEQQQKKRTEFIGISSVSRPFSVANSKYNK